MPLFPAYLDITNKNVLVVGAGEVASRKVKKLLLFSPQIKLVAQEANSEVLDMVKENSNIHFEQRAFDFADLEGVELVIAAIDDIPLQKEIFAACQKKRLPCNCVDSPDYCSFIFPSLVVRGDLTVGINTSGKAPYVSAQLRKYLDKLLPAQLDSVVEQVYEYRNSFADKKIAGPKIKQLVDRLLKDLI